MGLILCRPPATSAATVVVSGSEETSGFSAAVLCQSVGTHLNQLQKSLFSNLTNVTIITKICGAPSGPSRGFSISDCMEKVW